MVLATAQLAFITIGTASFRPGPPSGCVCLILLFVEPGIVSHFWFQLFPSVFNVFLAYLSFKLLCG